jgi:TonB-dependent SusC/RagA subfamily outer membrane receptor
MNNITRKKRFLFQIISLTLFVFISSCLVSGQEKVVEGRVTAFESIPIINANIEAKSNNEVVLTDTLGKFTISCAPADKLSIKDKGFARKKVKIKKTTKYVLVDLKLLPGPKNRELAVGYGHVKDAEKLYAISNVNESDLNFSRYSSIYDIMADMFSSSAQVTGSGEIIIRGTISTTGSDAALLIVDGREVDAFAFGNIITQDIASINVLKDASASVYGSRGANGVVIVETKRGR